MAKEDITALQEENKKLAEQNQQITETNNNLVIENQKLVDENKTLLEQRESMQERVEHLNDNAKISEEALAEFQKEMISYKAEMEGKLTSLAQKIAPEKNIFEHEGEQYSLRVKSFTMGGQPPVLITFETLKENPELIASVLEKFPKLVKKI